jgi:hypothetical protein
VGKAVPWTVAVVAILVAVALGVRPYVVRVPQPVGNLRTTRDRMEARGLKVSAVRLEGGGQSLGSDFVVGQTPRAGRPYLRGMVVTLKTKPDDGTVRMPDLVGRFAEDAWQRLDELGLRTTADSGAGGGVVVSQEPSAGVPVSFGAVVRYRAPFPHARSGLVTEVVPVHGVMYLRYGVEGARFCAPCHDATTCTGRGCHSGGAFRYLESVSPPRH